MNDNSPSLKILTAHQPAYLPWLGYFHKISLAHEFVLLDLVQYEKNSFINRNKIKVSNGEAWLTIPVIMKDHLGKFVCDMQIEERSDWRKKHWQSILMNYKRAPFFRLYADFFENYYRETTSDLTSFISISHQFILDELKIKCPQTNLSDMNVVSKKQDLIIDMCKMKQANVFIFGSQGKEYADTHYFTSQKINCVFQNYVHPIYNQLWGEFKPYMSVIDCLFNHGADATRGIILNNNLTTQNISNIYF